jgi:hypothetical protein
VNSYTYYPGTCENAGFFARGGFYIPHTREIFGYKMGIINIAGGSRGRGKVATITGVYGASDAEAFQL